MTVLQQTFVNSSEAELALQYASVVSKLRGESYDDASEDPVLVEARTAVEAGSEELRTLVEQYSSDAGAILNVPDNQVEGFFALLLSLIHTVSISVNDEDFEANLISRLVKSIEESPADKGILKMKLLTHTFNALSSQSTARYAVFTALVKTAAKHGELKTIMNQVQYLQQWSKDWGTPEADLWALYVLLAEKCISSGLFEEAFSVFVSHLNTKPTKKTGEVETLFIKAITAGLIPYPKVIDLSPLYVCPVSSALCGTPAHKLLTAYVHGDLLGYKQVQTELAGIITKSGIKPKSLSTDDIQKYTLSKMRQLYLTTLPLGTPASLTMLMKDLGVSSIREVEAVVISAVNNEIIAGKLDGVSKSLMLTSAFKFHFTIADWETLLSDLHSWKNGLNAVNKAIDQVCNGNEFDDDSDLDIDGLDGGFVSLENREIDE